MVCPGYKPSLNSDGGGHDDDVGDNALYWGFQIWLVRR